MFRKYLLIIYQRRSCRIFYQVKKKLCHSYHISCYKPHAWNTNHPVQFFHYHNRLSYHILVLSFHWWSWLRHGDLSIEDVKLWIRLQSWQRLHFNGRHLFRRHYQKKHPSRSWRNFSLCKMQLVISNSFKNLLVDYIVHGLQHSSDGQSFRISANESQSSELRQ